MSDQPIVLDTNILLISLPLRSPYRIIFNELISGAYKLAVSNEIISEYAEIIEKKINSLVATNVIELLLNLDNIVKVEIHYRWNLIESDPDDNKFVDCAIAAKAKYIVTNDKHFKTLNSIPFPPIKVLALKDFIKELTT